MARRTCRRAPVTGSIRPCANVLDAAVSWEYIRKNPAKLAGPQPQAAASRDPPVHVSPNSKRSPRNSRPPTGRCPSSPRPRDCVPRNGSVLERSDVDRRNGMLHRAPHRVRGEVVELAKTSASRRQVPLSPRALAAVDRRSREARHAPAVPATAGRAAEHRQLPPARSGRRRLRRQACQAGANLRPSRHVRQRVHRRGGRGVRDRPRRWGRAWR